jgi:hypothetical protein
MFLYGKVGQISLAGRPALRGHVLARWRSWCSRATIHA